MNSDELDLTLSLIINYPQAAAREIEQQPIESSLALLAQLPVSQVRVLLSQLLPAYAANLLNEISLDNLKELLVGEKAEQLSSILRFVGEKKREKILSLLPKKTATHCRLLLSYSLDTVGAWMTAEILMLPVDLNAGDALLQLTDCGDLFVADSIAVIDANKHLVGLVSLKKLLSADRETSLKRLMTKNYLTIKSRASLVSISEDDTWLEFDNMYVLNRNQQLIGVLRHLDLRLSQQVHVEKIDANQTDELVLSLTKTYFDSLGAMFGLIFNNKKRSSKTQNESLVAADTQRS